MKIKELRDKNIEELKKLLGGKKEYVRKLRFDISSKQVKNNREYRNTRKEVAKMLTLINESKFTQVK
ncbi:MAG: 50S ribosomal protein L29 [Parcubacteria group bacterium]|jgi:large subunit ribosomal protein L29